MLPTAAASGPALTGLESGATAEQRPAPGQFSPAGRPAITMSAPLLRSARLLLLVAACAAPLAAFPGGAPTEACLRGMVPNHRGTRSSSLATMPFSVTRQTTADGVRGEWLGCLKKNGRLYSGFLSADAS